MISGNVYNERGWNDEPLGGNGGGGGDGDEGGGSEPPIVHSDNVITIFVRLNREADEGPVRILGKFLATLQEDNPTMAVLPHLPGPNIVSNPASFPPNDSISKYLKETRTSQQLR